jgi:RNA polymerase sigma factor (sigma-70 family)
LPLIDHFSADDTIAFIPDDTDLEASMVDADLHHQLELAIAELPPLLRTLITLYHLDELGIPEIARITDLPVGTIKSHLFRARRRLRDRLAPLLETSP